MLADTLITMLIILLVGMSAAGDSFRPAADIMPGKTSHPLEKQISKFMKRQATFEFKDSGLTGKDYLKIIDGEVAYFRKCQDANGAIIDPVEKIEWQYSTPCYALSVALLAASGYNRDPEVLASGVKAMSCSVDEMHENRCAQNHGEFFIQPVVLALDLYKGHVPDEQIEGWKKKLSEIDPYALYPDNLRRKKACYNHNIVALAGEYLRPDADKDFVETHLAHHKQYFNKSGMYRDNPGLPMVYDEFSRQFLASILCEGYHGPSLDFYRENLWRGAWTSLFMQSPFGECPTGGRSAQHVWNEAQMCVTYEIYAAQYARKEQLAEAGVFKRAAHLSLTSMRRWLKSDGTAYVVKNRYPPEARHGYERYSAQSQYNLLACWLMAVAYLYADESVKERPCPAEVGGFVVPIQDDFHMLFANAGGTYVEYDTTGDLRFNPTGIIRIHLKGGNPQIGPSDGVVHKFDPKTKEDLGGERLAVGPAWQDASGEWHRLADTEVKPKIEILGQTKFKLTYEIEGVTVTEIVTVEPSGVTVEDSIEGAKTMRVYYPMLVFDGLEEANIVMEKNALNLSMRDGSVRFEVLEPKGIVLERTGVRLDNRNGQIEAAYGEIKGTKAVYRIGPQGDLKPMLKVTWERYPNPPQGFQDSDGGVVAGKLITVGGFCQGFDDAKKPGHYPRGFLKKAWALDLADPAKGWADLPDFPGDARQGLSCLPVGDALYCWGGFSYTKPYCYTDGYKLSGSTWESLPPLPWPISMFGISSLDRKVYVLGGADYDYEKFSTNTDRNGKNEGLGKRFMVLDTRNPKSGWHRLPDCPGTPRCVFAMAAVGGKIYVIGGANMPPGDEYLSVVDNWVFDPKTNEWTRIKDLPISSGNFPDGSIVYKDRYIILVGGFQYGRVANPDGTIRDKYGVASRLDGKGEYFNDVFIYDTKRDLFGRADSLPINNNMPMAMVHGDDIFVIGGEADALEIGGEYYGHHPDLCLHGKIEEVGK